MFVMQISLILISGHNSSVLLPLSSVVLVHTLDNIFGVFANMDNIYIVVGMFFNVSALNFGLAKATNVTVAGFFIVYTFLLVSPKDNLGL